MHSFVYFGQINYLCANSFNIPCMNHTKVNLIINSAFIDPSGTE